MRSWSAAGGALILTLGVAGCGKAKSAPNLAATPSAADALTQIAQTREGLAKALVTYRSGDVAAADRQVGDAYLQHFEIVETALDPKDKPLRLRIEQSIRVDLRARIKGKASPAELSRRFDAIKASLDRAEAVLR